MRTEQSAQALERTGFAQWQLQSALREKHPDEYQCRPDRFVPGHCFLQNHGTQDDPDDGRDVGDG